MFHVWRYHVYLSSLPFGRIASVYCHVNQWDNIIVVQVLQDFDLSKGRYGEAFKLIVEKQLF
jgi:hypothetical protein